MPELQDALEALSKLASRLAVRREGDLEEYLEAAGSLYDAYGYLPVIYPVHARNFTYYKVLSKASKEAETLTTLASAQLGVELDPSNPIDTAAAAVYWSVKLCVEKTRPSSSLRDTRFRVGSLEVGLKAYCEALAKTPLVVLVLAASTYYTYAPSFLLDSLSNFASKSATFHGCQHRGPYMALEDIALVIRECPDSYEGFRREMTSRVLTGLRALLASLYLVKWVYDPMQILALLEPGFVQRVKGIRSLYPVQPTYLGRLLSEVLEVWMHSLVDDRALRAFGLAAVEYYRLIAGFSEEPRRLGSAVRRWESLYVSKPVEEWVRALKSIAEESEALRAVNPLRLGEVVDDLVSIALNERAHALTAEYTRRPQLAELYAKFSSVDMKDLIFNRVLRVEKGV